MIKQIYEKLYLSEKGSYQNTVPDRTGSHRATESPHMICPPCSGITKGTEYRGVL